MIYIFTVKTNKQQQYIQQIHLPTLPFRFLYNSFLTFSQRLRFSNTVDTQAPSDIHWTSLYHNNNNNNNNTSYCYYTSTHIFTHSHKSKKSKTNLQTNIYLCVKCTK